MNLTISKIKNAKFVISSLLFIISTMLFTSTILISTSPREYIVYADPSDPSDTTGPEGTTGPGGTTTPNSNLSTSHGIGDVTIEMNSSGGLTIGGAGMSYSNASDAWNALISKFKVFVVGVTGLGTVAMILFFAYNFIKLGSTVDNDSARAKVIKGLIWSAVAAAGLGAVTIFVGFFYNAMR